MTKHKRSRKEMKAIKAKAKTKGFDIWEHQKVAGRKLRKVQKNNPKGHVWEDFLGAESKKKTKTEGLGGME
jgi:hypothetical protein